MKQPTILILTACAGIAAYAAGQWSKREPGAGVPAIEVQRPVSRERPRPPRGSREDAAAAVRKLGKYASCTKEFSAENAARLTPAERLELLTNGAWVGDYGNQAAMLCGLISVLTVDEIREAADILDRIQSQGNSQAPEVWQTLWQQWGRLDPEGCFKFFGSSAVARSPVDARNVMAGWLDTHAAAALSWAWEPGKSSLHAAAAALAISRSVNGDLEKLEEAILRLPAGEETSKVCLEDYFDLATLTGEDQTAATIYDALSPELRPAAWAVAARRMGYADSATAKAWVTRHASDPGRDYNGIFDLVNSLMHEDPGNAVRWVVQLPYSPEIDRVHPGNYPVRRWMELDPTAASEWLKTQSPDAPWIPRAGY